MASPTSSCLSGASTHADVDDSGSEPSVSLTKLSGVTARARLSLARASGSNEFLQPPSTPSGGSSATRRSLARAAAEIFVSARSSRASAAAAASPAAAPASASRRLSLVSGKWSNAGRQVAHRSALVRRNKSAPRLKSPRRNSGLGQGLIDAAQDGALDEVRRLLAEGAPIEHRDPASGSTALHAAVMHDNVGCADLLIASGAAIDGRNADELTPLMAAARYGCERSVRFLLLAGADAIALSDGGKTALDMAWLARAEGYGILEDCLQLLEDAEQRAWVRKAPHIAAARRSAAGLCLARLATPHASFASSASFVSSRLRV